MKPGRNDPCFCGSGKKYKKCCAQRAPEKRPTGRGQRAASFPPDTLSRIAELVNAGRYAELESVARELIALDPSSGVAWKVLSFSLARQGKDALAALENAAALMPEDAEAHSSLGNALRALGRLEESAARHRRAIAIAPQYADAHNNLGTTLQDLGQLEEAADSYRRAVAIKSEFALAHHNLGVTLRQLGRFTEAEASCGRALEIDPRFPAALVLLAELHADQGRFAAAEDALKRALAVDPDLAEAWAGMAGLRKMTEADAGWLEQAQRIAARPPPPRQEIHLRYALGKYFDDTADYPRAFDNYRRANELTKRIGASYDRQRTAAAVDRLIERHARLWIEQMAARANASPRPVFIVGMPRAGTTLAEQILASHPAVFGAGELAFWGSEPARSAAAGGDVGEAALGRLAAEYLRRLETLSADAQRVLDKMPENFLCLGLIHAALPRAKIIHMQRGPIDTCLSIYFQNFMTAHAYAADLEDLAHYYGQYSRIMEHWRATLPAGAILDVAYEDLVAETETWSRRMLEFLDLPWHPDCLEFHRTPRAIGTFSKWQARQKISRSSVGRWRHYEEFLGPLLRLEQPRE